MESRSLLVQYAHPQPWASRINRTMRDAIADLDGVHVNDLYARYPDFLIDAAYEKRLCAEADLVVFHHPLYWYSAPPLLREWQDRVLGYGWAYGREGTALSGKMLLSAVSTGGPERAFRIDGRNRFPLEYFLLPFDQMAHLCGMRYLAPLIFYGAHGADLTAVETHAAAYRERLIALRDGGEPDLFTLPDRDGTRTRHATDGQGGDLG